MEDKLKRQNKAEFKADQKFYSKKNIAKEDTFERQIQNAAGKLKIKKIKAVTYKNGVVKRSLAN